MGHQLVWIQRGSWRFGDCAGTSEKKKLLQQWEKKKKKKQLSHDAPERIV
jgi:hypothetical protein